MEKVFEIWEMGDLTLTPTLTPEMGDLTPTPRG